jgi:hypothetical protein
MYRELHGILMLITWGVLADIALIMVRYMKYYKNYIQIHKYILVMANVITLAFTLLIFFTVIIINKIN